MALAYSLSINGSIFTAPVTNLASTSALSIELDPILDVELDADAAIAAMDTSASTNGTSAIDDPDSRTNTSEVVTNTIKTTSPSEPSEITEVGVTSIEPPSVETHSVEVSKIAGAVPDVAKATANYNELTAFSLAGTLLYEDGAIAATTTNGNNENEFVLNAGTPFNNTLQTGELNLVSNTALYSYFGLAAPNADVVDLTSTVDPITGMEEVSITFDPDVADDADYNFFYPFLASAAYDPTDTIEITKGEILLTFSADSFSVEGSINVYGTDGTTDYLYSAELSGSVTSGYVGFAEEGPPILS